MLERAIQAVNLLTAVIMLAAGVYIQLAFHAILSAAAQSLVGLAAMSFFYLQVDLSVWVRGNNSVGEGLRAREIIP
ncbi:MAG TPA: hypothetical protein VN285_02375 [Candidatus Deferrimicrobium sp.]|nr:hypothetical protein [Candidatus Deferrimicrobium sp.]